MLRAWWSLALVASGFGPAFAAPPVRLEPKARARYETFLADLESGWESFRGASGLVADTIAFPAGADRPRVLQQETSPTNLGFDLLVLAERWAAGGGEPARSALERAIGALERLPRHEASGLFFAWYDADTGRVAWERMGHSAYDLSAVDNLHLALGLWTAARALAAEDPALAARARALFDRMDLSPFWDEETGHCRGLIYFLGMPRVQAEQGVQSAADWQVSRAYAYDTLGSEARSLVSVGGALGLFRRWTTGDLASDLARIDRSVAALSVRTVRRRGRRMQATWDGGVFQALLPDLLAGESRVDRTLGANARGVAALMLEAGARLGYPAAAGHSATRYRGDPETDGLQGAEYVGAAGFWPLVDPRHRELSPGGEARARMADVLTPHAVLLAARMDPSGYLPGLERLAALRSERGSESMAMSGPGYGFMAGYAVRGPNRGQVLGAQLSLDNAMAILSLRQILSPDGLGLSARALLADPEARPRLLRALRGFGERIRAEECSRALHARELGAHPADSGDADGEGAR